VIADPTDRTTSSGHRVRCITTPVKRASTWLLVAAGLLVCAPVALAGPPDRYEVRTIVAGLEAPTALAYAPDGRLFVAEKTGRVTVFAQGRLHEFLDLSDEVNHFSDRGLNNLAIDERGRLYLFFTEELRMDDPDKGHPAGGRLIRVEALENDPNRADPESRVTLLSGFDSHGPWHSVGGLDFDERGNLVVAFGDGSPYYPQEFSAAGLVAYDSTSMSGKVLRINPENGRGVPSNPEYRPQQPDSVRSKIIAIGFRMPYRLTVDQATDEIYVGDVGTDQYEEIDLVPGTVSEPPNYGWPCYEGGDDGQPVRRYPDESYCVTNFFSATNEDALTTAPAYAYSGEGGAAIVVGPQYAGEAYTDELDGKLVFADFIRDRFFTYDDGEVVDFGTPSDWGGPTDIAVTPRGTLAYTALLSGEVDEIVYLGGNEDSSSTRVLPWIIVALGLSGVAVASVYTIRRQRRSRM
jgi:glucose/arabinose dehydrogenase